MKLVHYPFSPEQVKAIQDFIKGKRESSEYSNNFVNTIIGEGIFDLLESCATLIYYPLDDENDGFHVSRPVSYQDEPAHFVFINTKKPVYKSIFVAAHELGHIWRADSVVVKMPGDTFDTENIMNRFAAELLMPEETFRQVASYVLTKAAGKTQKIGFEKMIYAIADLMDQFSVPYQAVVLRLAEVRMISESGAKILIDGPDGIDSAQFSQLYESILTSANKNAGYNKSNVTLGIKSIPGFAEMLEEAEEIDVASPTQISNLRALFEIEEQSNAPEVQNLTLTIDTTES